MKPNLIVTASDHKYGDFLIDHWFRSLREYSDSTASDVVVLDYGPSTAQRFYLEAHGVHLWPGKRDGHVAVVRYRELRDLLAAHEECGQVLLCDSGDIIFQGDIARIFDIEPERFRAVTEDYKPLFSVFISADFFGPRDRERLSECSILNPMINGGMVAGPRNKMMALADECLSTITDWTKFGPDQIVINDVLYREGFHELDKLYNYVVATAKEGIRIEGGVFKTAKGRTPIVVHNAGNVGLLRPVEDFGFGADRNTLKEEVYTALRALYQSTEGLFKTQELFIESRRRFRSRLNRLIRNLLPPGTDRRSSRREYR
jgi:hypothetical protein